MNAERLHAIVKSLRGELSQRNVMGGVEGLIAALRNMTAQPSNAGFQQTVVNSRETLRKALSDAPSDSFSPTWRQVLRDIGGEELFGHRLLHSIEDAINQNQMTPTVALQVIDAIKERLKAFTEALDHANGALELFRIGSEKLTPGECEIGILIPRQAVNNKLPEYIRELGEMEFILDTLCEVATGGVDDLEVRTLSSSDLMLFLAAHPQVGEIVAKAVDFIVTQYKKILEIRKVQREIERLELPEEISERTREHANKLMAEKIDTFTVEIMNEYQAVSDTGRRNELRNAVKLSLSGMANRIDRGFHIEVRIEPPPKDKATEEVTRAVQTIQAASVNMQFMKLEGPPILGLPEAAGEKDGAPERPRKRGRSRKE